MTATDKFTVSPPSTGGDEDRFRAADHEGRLVLFVGHRKDTFTGDWGPQDVARVDIVAVLDDPTGEKVYNDAMIFGAALVPQITRAVGPILGRISKGEGKAGKNAPWVLADPTPVDLKAAQAWGAKQLTQDALGNWHYAGDTDPF